MSDPKGHKIKKFLPQWLDKPHDGVLTSAWLKPHPQEPRKAICIVCPGTIDYPQGKVFSILEGWCAIKSHADGVKHKNYYKSSQDPNHNSVENLRKKWRYIAEKFPNVIKIQEIPQLLEEVRVLKTMSVKEGTSPEEFIADIEMKVDEDSGKVFKLVSKIAKALLSIHNSSSSAERDFSLQNYLTDDKRKNRTGQFRLQTRLFIKSNVHSLRSNCDRCQKKEEFIKLKFSNEDKEDNETVDDDDETEEGTKKRGEATRMLSHCHCSLFSPSQEMIASMSGGLPYRRFKEYNKKRNEEEKVKLALDDLNKQEDENKRKNDLQLELQRLEKKLDKEKVAQSNRDKEKENNESGKKKDKKKDKNKNEKQKPDNNKNDKIKEKRKDEEGNYDKKDKRKSDDKKKEEKKKGQDEKKKEKDKKKKEKEEERASKRAQLDLLM